MEGVEDLEAWRVGAVRHFHWMFVFGVATVVAILIGSVMLISGLYLHEALFIVAGIIMMFIPIMVYAPIRGGWLSYERAAVAPLSLWELRQRDRYRHIQARDDARRRKLSRVPGPPPDPPSSRGPFQSVPAEGPGTCPSCGGALFYGRVNCPHCSESIFLDAGEASPPEL
jgi:hypothetical protein